MNTNTGQIYELGKDLFPKDDGEEIKPGMPLFAFDLKEQIEGLSREPTADEKAAAEAEARGEAIVQVEAEVVQKLRLGERELERRRKRKGKPEGPPNPPDNPRHRPVG